MNGVKVEGRNLELAEKGVHFFLFRGDGVCLSVVELLRKFFLFLLMFYEMNCCKLGFVLFLLVQLFCLFLSVNDVFEAVLFKNVRKYSLFVFATFCLFDRFQSTKQP